MPSTLTLAPRELGPSKTADQATSWWISEDLGAPYFVSADWDNEDHTRLWISMRPYAANEVVAVIEKPVSEITLEDIYSALGRA